MTMTDAKPRRIAMHITTKYRTLCSVPSNVPSRGLPSGESIENASVVNGGTLRLIEYFVSRNVYRLLEERDAFLDCTIDRSGTNERLEKDEQTIVESNCALGLSIVRRRAEINVSTCLRTYFARGTNICLDVRDDVEWR